MFRSGKPRAILGAVNVCVCLFYDVYPKGCSRVNDDFEQLLAPNVEDDDGDDYSAGAIRSVQLVVDPPAVRRSQHATLTCMYDLEDTPLYSVKFYRGLREFYRFSPSEYPEKKIFPFPGINVDLSLSNASQVVIRNIGFGLSGNFSCEVTADAPLFSTATGHLQMQVVEISSSFSAC
ncbi:conserved hypothetical protein [Culex quinquefasciatus]|uniref:Ig-like domain-containing protein n=1 Tax=Culex quinquefasciatus TaxID=7176 RepID=B0XBE3_CULQU|nr:conserved hypothetical protein [Culex quinquefasciatus]|eukprot:XP_001866965.1 conserved hypothetical protein [Culex quinquefasciatus]